MGKVFPHLPHIALDNYCDSGKRLFLNQLTNIQNIMKSPKLFLKPVYLRQPAIHLNTGIIRGVHFAIYRFEFHPVGVPDFDVLNILSCNHPVFNEYINRLPDFGRVGYHLIEQGFFFVRDSHNFLWFLRGSASG